MPHNKKTSLQRHPAKRTALTLSLSAALAAMVANTGHAAVITYSTISNGALVWGGMDVLITDTGGFRASATTALYATPGFQALTNNGVLSSQQQAGVIVDGQITTLTNGSTGTINSDTLQAIKINGLIQVLNNSGTISSPQAAIGNMAGGSIGSLLNSGSIVSAGGTGISNSGVIDTLSNNSIGTISGGNYAINNSPIGTISTLSNNGIITSGNTGIYNAGRISTLTNGSGGTIAGSAYGIYVAGGNIGTINNSGLISGGSRALYMASGNVLGNLVNTGVIAGLIECNCSASFNQLTITGGAIGSNVFGTLTGVSGGIGAADASAIAFSGGVVFNGNQLLNDNIAALNGGVTNNGVLQVNNSMTISGSYTQGSGATLVIGVVNPGNGNIGNFNDTGYGRLVVFFSVSLDDSSVVIKSAGHNLAAGQRYVVLTTNHALSANNVTYSAAGFTATGAIQTDTSDPSFQDLVVTLSGGTGAGTGAINNATNGNARAALGGLLNYSGTNVKLLAVYNPAAALDTAGANKAGAQLSPVSVNGAATQSVGATSQAIGNVITSRMDGTRLAQAGAASGIATGETMRDVAVWGQLFDGRASQGMRDGISGYHGNYHGLVLGADGQASDALRIGGAFSVAKSSVASDGDNTGSSANVNNYGLSAYGTYSGAPWYLNAMAGVSRQQYSTVRNIGYTGFSGSNNGSFNGRQLTAAVQLGYPLNLDAWMPGATLTPTLGLRYARQRVNGYAESGSAAALTVNATSASSFKSELGAKLERGFQTAYGRLLPALELGWRHEYRNDRMQTGASFTADDTRSTAFTAQSATPVANTGVLSLGVTLLRSDRLSLNARYTLETGGGYLAQTGSVLVRWRY